MKYYLFLLLFIPIFSSGQEIKRPEYPLGNYPVDGFWINQLPEESTADYKKIYLSINDSSFVLRDLKSDSILWNISLPYKPLTYSYPEDTLGLQYVKWPLGDGIATWYHEGVETYLSIKTEADIFEEYKNTMIFRIIVGEKRMFLLNQK